MKAIILSLIMAISIDFTGVAKFHSEIYWPLRTVESRFRLIYGGAGSGKSCFMARDYIEKIVSCPGRNFLCVRKVGTSLETSVYNDLQDVISMWGLDKVVKGNKTKKQFNCVNGNQIICVGLYGS